MGYMIVLMFAILLSLFIPKQEPAYYNEHYFNLGRYRIVNEKVDIMKKISDNPEVFEVTTTYVKKCYLNKEPFTEYDMSICDDYFN